MDRLRRHVPISKRYKLGVDGDTFINLGFVSNTKPIAEYDIDSVVNVEDVFDDERKNSSCYRFSGRLNVITANELTPDATNSDWDILFDGDPAVMPNNWLLQILYPVESDGDFVIKSRTDSGNPQTKAELGPQFTNIISAVPNGTDQKIGIRGVQNHNLVEGDFVYIYSTTSLNTYQGIHQVLTIGIGGGEIETSFVLDTPYTIVGGPGNYKKVLNTSTQDGNYSNTIGVTSIVATDISGGTTGVYAPGEKKYTKVTSLNKHDLLLGDYIDIRGNGVLNGLYEVVYVVDEYNYVIKLEAIATKGLSTNFPIPRPTFRRMDGTPSEYYVRHFEVLTTNDYETYRASFSTNVYTDSVVNEVGVANDTWLYHYNTDINLLNLRNNRNAEISEVYLGIIKRAGENTYAWSNVTADWEYNKLDMTTINGLELISRYNPGGVGSIEKPSIGDRYVGDYVEYNRLDIKEKTISEIAHRFGVASSGFNETNSDTEGYYHTPFKKMRLRVYSEVIETSPPGEITIDIPSDFERYPDGTLAWRDLLDIGIFEPTNPDRVDYPFVNGCHYYNYIGFIYVRRQDPQNNIIDQRSIITVNPKELC